MSKADDPERLLAEALRAQAANAGVPSATQRPLPADDHSSELATVRIQQTHDVETDRFSPLDNVLGPISDGPGFGLLSGTEVGSVASGAYRAVDPVPQPMASQAQAMVPTRRPSVWLIVLTAIVLGLAAGVAVGLFSVF